MNLAGIGEYGLVGSRRRDDRELARVGERF